MFYCQDESIHPNACFCGHSAQVADKCPNTAPGKKAQSLDIESTSKSSTFHEFLSIKRYRYPGMCFGGHFLLQSRTIQLEISITNKIQWKHAKSQTINEDHI